jgi:hypothetical protein
MASLERIVWEDVSQNINTGKVAYNLNDFLLSFLIQLKSILVT